MKPAKKIIALAVLSVILIYFAVVKQNTLVQVASTSSTSIQHKEQLGHSPNGATKHEHEQDQHPNNNDAETMAEQESNLDIIDNDAETMAEQESNLDIIDSSTGRLFEGTKFRSFQTRKGTRPSDNETNVKATGRQDLLASNNFTNSCNKWGVVTTIFDPTFAIQRAASLPSWCLVVVADTKTPKNYMQKLQALFKSATTGIAVNASDAQTSPDNNTTTDTDLQNNTTTDTNTDTDLQNVFFFSVEKQKEWEHFQGALGSFVKSTPWNHFCRKNLGYLFAILHGAEFIFDFDDDNYIKVDDKGAPISILPSEEMLSNVTIASLGPNVFNHHPMMKPSINETSWARGFPLDKIQHTATQGTAAFQNDLPFKSKADEIGVIQFLADDNPDVDAYHRLSKTLPMTFKFDSDAHPVLVPKHSYSPYNAQATIHTANALWAVLLPSTVLGRVSDIWRSYFAQCIFADAGLRLVFAPPKISQLRNDHNILGDLRAENDLYLKTGKLIDFLAEWDSEQSSIPERMEQLWIDLYDRGYIEIQDVEAVQMWLGTLKQIEYNFPPLKRRFRNVAVMGQFNYADSPNICNNVIFWAQKHREHFDTVIAAGPFSEDQLEVLGKNSIDTIISHPYHKPGYYAPFENQMNSLKRFANSTKIEGVIYVHDDALMNVTELSQGLYPFPTKEIIGNNFMIGKKVDDLSYRDVRTFHDRERAARLSYRLFPNGTYADYNKTIYSENMDTLFANITYFYNNWEMLKRRECAGAQVKLAADPAVTKYREEDGSLLFPKYTQADFLFVPTRFSEEFAEAADLHLKHGVYLECAVPKIVDMIRQQSKREDEVQVRVVELCTCWGGRRARPASMINDLCKHHGKIGIAHPVKISGSLQVFSEQMDDIQ
jgi:hypothetical protein